jgi:broad specificity phosphatase PhoE
LGTPCNVPARELIVVRHGESEGNAARDAAEAAHDEVIPIDRRDPDVPLTALGQRQAASIGRWLAHLPPAERPTGVWSSPYLRAVQTARAALAAAGLSLPIRVDDRLRDRELGVLDRLTGRGVTARFPDEAARRRYLGKLYYRPPGGESWTDVALRLRSLITELDGPGEERLLISCHDAVVLLLRYVLEGLDEAALMEIAGARAVGNASITRLIRDGSGWRATLFNDQEHLDGTGGAAVAQAGEGRGSTS